MKIPKLTIAAALAVAAAAGTWGVLYAQQPGFTRTVLQDQDLSIKDRHAVVARAEFIPGGGGQAHAPGRGARLRGVGHAAAAGGWPAAAHGQGG